MDDANARPGSSATPAVRASTDAAAKAIEEAARLYTRAAPAKGAPTQEAVDGIAAFAVALYKIAAKADDNVVLSPLSIAYAFAMARVGARGETAAQLDKAFGFPAGRDGAFNALTNGLATSSAPPSPKPATDPERNPKPEDPILAIANGLFVQKDYTLAQGFLRALTEQYGEPPPAAPSRPPADFPRRHATFLAVPTAQGGVSASEVGAPDE